MDIAIEKINKLLLQQQTWIKRIDKAKIDYEGLLKEKEIASLELNKLLTKRNDLDVKKEKILLGNKQIKAKEKQAKIRFWVVVAIINIFLIALLITITKPLIILFLIAATNLVLDPNIEILSGLKDCKSEKEYLKNNTLEAVQQEIEENRKKINLQKEKISTKTTKIKKTNDDILQMENFVEIFRERIEEINNIRKTAIDNFLMNNQVLDNLVNDSYLKYEEQNKLVKKKIEL